MKFGRVLALRAIPEWRESYVEYKRLKRLLYRLPDPKGGRDDDFSPAASPEASLSSSASNLMPLSQPLLTGDYADVSLHFFAELEEGLARANELVCTAVAACATASGCCPGAHRSPGACTNYSASCSGCACWLRPAHADLSPPWLVRPINDVAGGRPRGNAGEPRSNGQR